LVLFVRFGTFQWVTVNSNRIFLILAFSSSFTARRALENWRLGKDGKDFCFSQGIVTDFWLAYPSWTTEPSGDLTGLPAPGGMNAAMAPQAIGSRRVKIVDALRRNLTTRPTLVPRETVTRTFAGFMSYVRVDDQHENGRLTELCSRISGEVRMQRGEEFPIFQDRNDISWGQQWKQRIEDTIDATTFLIPIITPSFFKSPACRDEVERFLDRENRLGRSDLILPIYFVNCPALANEKLREGDKIAQIIAARQHADWRELRFEPFTTPSVGKTVAGLAAQIVRALDTLPSERSSGSETTSGKTVGGQRTQADESSEIREPTPTEKVQRTSASKKEPPTLIVDALHRGDYSNLTGALQAAKPGHRILIRPGLYQEGITIDNAVEIIGDGDPGEVVIEATGKDVILFRANMGRVVNLTLRQMGGGKWFCVDIRQGRLDLEGCDITSASLTCVAIRGGADPRLRRNRIHDGKQSGVHVYESGLGTLEDNEIFGNALAGVSIKSGGNPTLRRNRIHDGKQGGVMVYESGLGALEDNEIFGNARANVEIKSGGNPMLRRNRIHDGKASGVLVHESGLGTLEDNEIFGNALAGVMIKTGGNPTLRRNRIYDGKQGGVFSHENGLGTLEDKEIFGNAMAGVQIKTAGNPTLRRNRIHDSKQSGVYIFENGLGTLEDNEILGNANAGVRITSGGNPTLRRNVITKNLFEGCMGQ
jgi:parallel beta-helix repeat protein